MDNVSLLDNAGAGLIRLHEAVQKREPGHPDAALSPEELLTRFRAADPTLNGSCMPWLLRTYASGGYRLEDLTKAHDTLKMFARFRGSLPDTLIIDGEIRNPRKLGSHTSLASLWTVIAPFVEQEGLAENTQSEDEITKKRILAQSRIILRDERMVVVVPLTEEASCWWGRGTQWCTAARKDNAFKTYHRKAPLIIICLRRKGDLPACKLQLHVTDEDVHFMNENDASVSLKLIEERWEELEPLVHWVVEKNGGALRFVPEPLRTPEICLAAVVNNGCALYHVPEHLRTLDVCLAAVVNNGYALYHVPEYLRTLEICLAAVGSNGWVLEHVPEPLRTPEICLAAVVNNGCALYHVPEHLRTLDVCLAAVVNNGCALYHVPEPLRTPEICLAAVVNNGCALYHVPEPLRTLDVCLAAVSNNGYALECVPEPLRTLDVCLAAVSNNGQVIKYVPEHLRTLDVCLAAVGGNGYTLEYVSEHLRADILRVIELVRLNQKPSVIEEADAFKSHDLELTDLENSMNKLPFAHPILHDILPVLQGGASCLTTFAS